RAYHADPATGKLAASLSQQRREVAAEQDARLRLLRDQAGEEIVEVERQLVASQKPAGNPTDAFGYHSALSDRADAKKWVQIDLGQAISVAAVSVRPCYDDFNQIGAGFGFPKRYRILGSSDPSFEDDTTRELVDRTKQSQPNPGTRPLRFDQLEGRFRYVRLEATELAPRSGDFMLAISELEVWDREGMNLAAGKAVEAFDSIEAPARWQKSNLTDGKFPGDSSEQPPSHWVAVRNQLFQKANPTLFEQWLEANDRLDQLDRKIQDLPPPQLA
ncbi:MAG: discoidin domain-containing protein, partial [Pirellulaceae bacterium]